MLYDAFGRPVRRRKLPGNIDIFWHLPQVEALSSWDVAAAKSAAAAHETGDFTISGRMFWAMLTDPRIADGVSKRALALRGVPFEIVPGKGQRAKTVAEKFRQAWPAIRPPEVAAEMHGQALLNGLSVLHPLWGYAADHARDGYRFPDDGWYYPRLRTWEPTALQYQRPGTLGAGGAADPMGEGQLVALTQGSQRAAQGEKSSALFGQEPVIPGTGQWIMFQLAGDRRPWMFGRMRSVWRAWVSRLMNMLLWLRFNDVHGLPIRGVRVPHGMKKTPETRAFYEGVKNLGRDATFLMPQGSDGRVGVGIDLIEAKSESWKSFEQGLAYYGTEITVCLTGGTQNAEAVGGNYKGAEEQREIRHEVKAADAEADQRTTNEQLCIPFATLNGYDPEEAPRLVYDTRPPTNRKAEAEAAAAEYVALQEAATAVTLMRAAGYEVTIPELLASRGEDVPPGKTVQVQVPAQAPGAPPAA